jgi:[ribosomal protein S18]-alanine N-acetyltransferase
MLPMHIRPLVLNDYAHASRLHKNAFYRGWSEKDIQELLEGSLTWGLKIEENRELLGYIIWREVADEAEILTLIIDPLCQRKGYATQLLETVCNSLIKKKIFKLFIEVAEDNNGAQSFYKAHGSTYLTTRPNYVLREGGRYRSALLFVKTLG